MLALLLLLLLLTLAHAIPEFNLPPTHPFKPEFTSVRLQTGAEYSTSHCFSNSLQSDGWRTTSCYVKNLCFNTTDKTFLLFSKNGESQEEEAFPPVSIGTFNFKWGKQYDKTVKFRPQVRFGPIPARRAMASSNELWLPFLPFCPANIGHLIWDDYLTAFLLTWAVRPISHQPALSLRPLWYNPPEDPPWATCDWIRLHEGPGHSLRAGYSDRCLKNNKRWLPLLLGAGNDAMLETSKFSFEDSKNGSDLVCFPHAALGPTSFANQASGHHGWNRGDPPAPAFGRGPMLFHFTRHMMKQIGARDAPQASVKELSIFFSSGSSDRVYIDFTSSARAVERETDALESLVRSVTGNTALRVVVKHAKLFELSAREQVDLVSTACVYVTAAGGGAFTAQFLPRGSAILLYEQRSGEHHHEGRVDWKFFNALGWIRTTFWDVNSARGDDELLLEQIRREVVQCALFMDALVKD